MFAYSLNNPIRYKDTNGQAVQDCFDETDDRSDPFDDMGSRGGNGPIDSQSNGSGGFSGGYRGALQAATGSSGEGMDAHHVYPQQFGSQFTDLGINIHDPNNLAWWESGPHRQSSYEYNLWWKAFFALPAPTKEEAEMLAEFLASLFGYDWPR